MHDSLDAVAQVQASRPPRSLLAIVTTPAPSQYRAQSSTSIRAQFSSQRGS